MKIDRDIAKQLRIPTKGMQEFRITYRQFDSIQTEVNATKFFRDEGQLYSSGDETELVYLVQREDGVVEVVLAGLDGVNAYHILKEHLDPDVKAEVIECKISNALLIKCRDSDVGVLTFYAFHHPDREIRKGLALGLLECEDAKENTSGTH